MPAQLLAAEKLVKTFGATLAVAGADFSVYPGEIFGFLGPNGAGKTTTIKMMTGLLRPTSGRTLIDGVDVACRPVEAKRLFGYVPDEPQLYGKLSALEFLNFIGDVYGLDAATRKPRILELLKIFELSGEQSHLIESYSHGMKQKVALCAALLHAPRVYFLDEPTVGLDPKSARLLKDLLRQAADAGAAVFMSTHIMEIAQALCDRVAILHHGDIVGMGSVAELRASSAEQTLEEVFLSLTGGSNHTSAPLFGRPA
ncbi:MAG: ABC transporter ATP-binding protein [Candidatus Eremiobacteraeota bacterium]|nr:ABC transporter ATP-binding protein [Candidatus Eremiobacteraeota bacterium]